ncbi:MAG: hypothetical protein LUM44_00415 [Pyrinomonadaceae bacterium]|nr:hypothetical protein [Pyrinomonadaceae bacterium]
MIKDNIKKYLLGELSESEAERFEEESSLNEQLFEEVCLTESELIDDYLSYRLSPADRKSFENNYLKTDARREKIEAARIFLAGIEEIRSGKAEKAEKHRGGFFTFLENQLLWRFALGGLSVLVLFVCFVYFINYKDKKSEISKLEEPVKQIGGENKNKRPETVSPPVTPDEDNERPSAVEEKRPVSREHSKNDPADKPTVSAKKIKSKGGKMLGFVLLPGTLRSEGEQFIKFPRKTSKVKLKLQLPQESEKYESYQVTLKNAEGDTISQQTDLKTPNITLPTEKLQKQTYVIYLEGKKAKNSPESIAEFTFRVRR